MFEHALLHDANGRRIRQAHRTHSQDWDEVRAFCDTVVGVFSCTKAITGTAVMQLVEDGKLDLDAPAKRYAPGFEKIKVLEGFDAAGNPKVRAPKRDVTTRMLMLHTAGFSYDFFNEDYLRLTIECGLPSVITCSKAALDAPLIFDPGEGWEYGISLDWCAKSSRALPENGSAKSCRNASLLRWA